MSQRRTSRLLILAAVSAGLFATAAPVSAHDRDEARIGFQSARGLDPETNLQRIFSMATDGSDVRSLLPETFDNSFDLAWSPDGRRFAFTTILPAGYFEIHVARADGTRVRRITVTGDEVHDAGPAWAPRGNVLAYVSDRRQIDDFDLYLTGIRPPFGEPFNVTNRPGNDCGCYAPAFIFAAPSWSPDGRRLAFTSDIAETANFDVYVINRDGTGLQRLTSEPGVDAEPDWSPDGRRLAFNSVRDGDAELFVMRPDGTRVRQLSHNEAIDDTQPDWSPTGRAIAFTSTAAGNGDIWVMDAHGDDARRLTDDPALDERAAWQPHRDRHGHDHDDD